MNASLLLHVSISYNSKAAASQRKISDFSSWLPSFTRTSCSKRCRRRKFSHWKQQQKKNWDRRRKKLILKFQISVASVTAASNTTNTNSQTIGTTTSECSQEDWIATAAATATDSTVFQASTVQPAAAASNSNSRFQLVPSARSTFISLADAANKLLTAKRTILHYKSQSKSECCCWRFVQLSTMGTCG